MVINTPFSLETIYFIELYLTSIITIITSHALRGRFTLAPLFAVVGIQIMLLWQMRQLGWWLNWGTLKIDTALLAFVPPLLLGLLFSYAMDGIRVARAYVGVMMLTALVGCLFAEFHDGLAHQVPIPYVFYLSRYTHLVAVLSLLTASIVTMVSYDLFRKLNTNISFLLTPAVASIVFSFCKNIFEYGFVIGWGGFVHELPEYIVFTIPCMIVSSFYGHWAYSHQLLMPKRNLKDIVSLWRITESNLTEMRADVMNANKIISELRQLNYELEEAQRINRYQMRKNPIGTLLINLNGKIQYANPAAEKIFGGPVAGSNFFQKIHNPQALSLNKMAISSSNVTVKIDDLNDHECWYELAATYRYNAQKQPVGYSVMIKDITRQLQLKRKQNIENKLRDIQNAGSVISHDFSNLFLGMQGLLLQLENTSNKNDIVFQQGISSLKATIGRGREMLSQLVSGQVISQPYITTTNLREIIQEAITINLTQAKDKNIKIVLANSLDITLYVDGGQICRVITNLIKNGLRATAEGGEINIDSQHHRGGVLIRIKDNGSGMSEEQLSHAFEPGYSTKPEGQGGLGLAISQQIIEAHEGRLLLSNNSDGEPGMTASIWLPHMPINVQEQEKNILLGLEPSPISDKIIMALEKAGNQITETCNQEEFDALLEEESDWDIILSQFKLNHHLNADVTWIEVNRELTEVTYKQGDETTYNNIRELLLS
ncbi:sensor histidine kinase [Methylomarinum vadi]|uniref:sensor histidine kinase n=1 Tax=Methylomarinum vadi TaxID=438855 RepID=UPI0004DFC201|nr:ATP-binding protein [Methylomarinum vadi]